MYFLFSGEGVTDMGSVNLRLGQSRRRLFSGSDGNHGGPCRSGETWLFRSRYMLLWLHLRAQFVESAVELKTAKKSLGLPGKKRGKETRYYFNNARVLSRIAKEKQVGLRDEMVAVLFRDSDGTASAGRGLWDEKRKSMLDGFDEEKFSKGVPMIPKPKSEAWLICALKKHAYQNCHALENRSGNDNSPKSLKDELSKLLGEKVTPELLCEKVRKKVDIDKIKMPSFLSFRDRLEEVI